MEFQFMQLAGNCACIGYLGKNRIKGPVDNVVTLGTGALNLLLKGEYAKAVIDWADKSIVSARVPNFEGDSTFAYKFKYVLIVHNDPKDKKYQEELIKRYNTFLSFLKKVKANKNYYFTFNLNEIYIDRITHKLNTKELEKTLNLLKEYDLLSKVIFISTKSDNKQNWWNFYSDQLNYYIEKFSLKHITINNLDFSENTHKQFIEKMKGVFKNEIS